MGLITAVEKQKKRADRVNVFIDEEFAFGSSAEIAYLNKLKIGRQVTDSEIKDLIHKDQVERLLNKALRFLGSRPHSEKEVKDYLTYKGKLKDLETEEEKQEYLGSMDQVTAKLKELNYLNDTEFASWWVKERGEIRSISERILRSELVMKGVNKEVVNEVLNKVESEEEKANKIAQKKAKTLRGLAKEEFRRKLSQFLARRGFAWDLIKKIVDRLVQKG
ncbi:MAG: RecX family transcriptional regulator [bacterium]|nr:RecX family transcriptional regulator [bacterium]